MIRDIRPGRGSGPDGLTAVNGALYFSADDGVHGRELWRSDGTAAGTRLVRDIRPGADPGATSWLTDVGGVLYFSADDGVHGRELWRSDRATGTTMVRDINPGVARGAPDQLTALNGTLYFGANDGVHGTELWRTTTDTRPRRADHPIPERRP